MRTREAAKKQLEEWEIYVKNLQAATPQYSISETEQEKQARIESLKNDYEAFVEYYFYAITRGTKSARFHIQTANQIAKNPKIRIILEWARGHAKSTHVSLFIPLWLMARGEIKNLMLVSYTEEMATRLLSKIQAHLEKNPRFIADFGTQVNIGNWQSGEFTTLQGVYFTCRGAGQSPRGASSDESYRPDCIIIDDLDEDELVENPSRVRKMVDWVMSALFGAMDMGRGRFIMVGNKIHKNSVLANLVKRGTFRHLAVNALDKHGKPSWSEKYTLEEIEQMRIDMGERAFQKEFMNNPTTEGTVFKDNQIIFVKAPKFNEYSDIVLYVDPSFKNTAKSDHKACVLLGKKGTNIYILAIFNRKASITDLINWLYNSYEGLPEFARPISRWYSEANFMQGDLIDNALAEEGEARGYTLPLSHDTRKKPDKHTRIEALSPFFEKGVILFSDKLKGTTDTEKAIEHLLGFEKGARVPDDFPDALEGGVFKIMQSTIASSGSRQVRIGKQENNHFY